MLRSLVKKKCAGWIVLAAALCSFGLAQSPPQSEPLLPVHSPVDSRLPFQPGEELRYEVYYDPPAALFFLPAFKAGDLNLQVEATSYNGHPALKLLAHGTSSGLLASMFGVHVDDTFESIVDKNALSTLRFYEAIREGKRKREREQIIDYANGTVRFLETNLSLPPPQKPQEYITKGITTPLVDYLSVFYVARSRPLTPEKVYSIDMVERGKPVKYTVQILERGRVKVNGTNLETVKATTVGRFFTGGGAFRIWFAMDAKCTPVRFEADTRFGKVFGSIVKELTPKNTERR